MTLVIACITDDIGFMVSDTILSSRLKVSDFSSTVNGRNHALKVQILDSFTAVAFAGDVHLSFQIIKNTRHALCSDSEINVPQKIFEEYQKLITDSAIADCEFLVLQNFSEGRKLSHITIKEIKDCERAYIGDTNEYKNMKSLQRTYTPPKTQVIFQSDGTSFSETLTMSPGEIEFQEIAFALESLCRKKRSSSVGAICDCIIRVADAKTSGKLEYFQMKEASLSPEEGHAGFSVLASNIEPRGIGIYFISGKMGIVFIVGDSEYCRKENASSQDEFIKLIQQKYGLQLE